MIRIKTYDDFKKVLTNLEEHNVEKISVYHHVSKKKYNKKNLKHNERVIIVDHEDNKIPNKNAVNEWNKLPSDIGKLTTLKHLNLNYCYLKSLPPEIGQLNSLAELNLQNNSITSLPPEIGQLTSLKTLRLSNNNLKSLPPEIGQLTSLEDLQLDMTELLSLPIELSRLKYLKKLNLLDTFITKIPHQIETIPNIVINYSPPVLFNIPLDYNGLNNLVFISKKKSLTMGTISGLSKDMFTCI